MPLKAVIFDLDGTVIDNEWIYDHAFCEVLKEFQVSCEELNHVPGIGIKENWERMVSRFEIDRRPEELTEMTKQAYLRRLKEIKVRDGVREFIYDLRGKGLKTILATSTTRELATQVLETLNLTSLFDTQVFGDDVARKKPAPDLFLKALDTLNLLPKEVIVIEDSAAGVAAGKNAGMKVIGLKTDWFTRSQLYQADLILEDFSKISDQFRHDHFIKSL